MDLTSSRLATILSQLRDSGLVSSRDPTSENIDEFRKILNYAVPIAPREQGMHDALHYLYKENKPGFLKLLEQSNLTHLILFVDAFMLMKQLDLIDVVLIRWNGKDFSVEKTSGRSNDDVRSTPVRREGDASPRDNSWVKPRENSWTKPRDDSWSKPRRDDRPRYDRPRTDTPRRDDRQRNAGYRHEQPREDRRTSTPNSAARRNERPRHEKGHGFKPMNDDAIRKITEELDAAEISCNTFNMLDDDPDSANTTATPAGVDVAAKRWSEYDE